MKTRYILIAFWSICSLSFGSCEKYLDAKPNQKLIIPETVQDLQLLLDDYFKMNAGSYPFASEIVSDNYYMLPSVLDALKSSNLTQYNLHIWEKDENVLDYVAAYNAIYQANVVLDNFSKIKISPTEKDQSNYVKGSALFFRAMYFYGLSQIYAKAYNLTTASADLGIPLRTTADFNEKSFRSTVQETYDRILFDLKEAASLLPEKSTLKSRPTRPAAYGALARTYLSMQKYDSAGVYANYCLQLYDTLMDFNKITKIEQYNPEVIFQMRSLAAGALTQTRAKIDTNLYKSYHVDDLRKDRFFVFNSTDKTYAFKGDYDGVGASNGTNTGYVFAGIVTDEVLLIRAECYARAGNKTAALQDLNKLMKSRWKAATWTAIDAPDANFALLKILTERRKELLFRGTRWTDLRRFMNDPLLAVTPKRNTNAGEFQLTPGSPRYVLLIPRIVIENTGMPQNP